MAHRSLLLATALAALLLPTAACADDAELRRIDPASLDAALQEGRLLLDVRTPEEWAGGHVPGATLVPLQELPERLDEVERAGADGVVVYCESGARAARAARMLREAGLEEVALLEGSMRRWRAEGRPVETPPAD